MSPTKNYLYCICRGITSKDKVLWHRLITLKAHNCTVEWKGMDTWHFLSSKLSKCVVLFIHFIENSVLQAFCLLKASHSLFSSAFRRISILCRRTAWNKNLYPSVYLNLYGAITSWLQVWPNLSWLFCCM